MNALVHAIGTRVVMKNILSDFLNQEVEMETYSVC